MRAPDSRPLSRLPHHGPSLLLSEGAVNPSEASARGRKSPPHAEPHLSGAGFFPAALLVEMMAQTAGLLLPASVTRAYVAALRKVEIEGAASAGEEIETEARLTRRFGLLYQFDCAASAGGRRIARGTVVLACVASGDAA